MQSAKIWSYLQKFLALFLDTKALFHPLQLYGPGEIRENYNLKKNSIIMKRSKTNPCV